MKLQVSALLAPALSSTVVCIVDLDVCCLKRLGISGAIRFLMQYDLGHGDYTVERQTLFAGLTLDDALTEIRNREELPR